MKPIERVEELIKFKGLSVSGFEQAIGVANATISASLKRNSNLKDETLNSILNAFPEISAEWLLTGKGEMLRREDMAAPHEIPEYRIEDIIARKVSEVLADRLDRHESAITQLSDYLAKHLLEYDAWREEVDEAIKKKTQ